MYLLEFDGLDSSRFKTFAITLFISNSLLFPHSKNSRLNKYVKKNK